ncbi:MAG: hypothetical protein HZB26_01470 [Candidatus Hydrogenedentes bacterium]|nr:hypothetical protein [Candidatus Hydrogenedentota bacterium]
MFSGESKGAKLPFYQGSKAEPLSPASSSWPKTSGPAGWQVFPEYISDPKIGKCPSSGMDAPSIWTPGPDNNRPSFFADLGAYNTVGVFTPLSAADLATWCNVGSCNGETPFFGTYRWAPVGGPKVPTVTFDYTYVNRLVKAEWIANATDNGTLAFYLMCGDDAATQGVTNQQTEQSEVLNITSLSVGPIACHLLKEGVERFLITDINNPASSAAAQSNVPILWDYAKNRGNYYSQPGITMFNHVPGGANILYLDGHVQFVKFPAELTQATWPLARVSLDKQPPPPGVPYTDPADGYW